MGLTHVGNIGSSQRFAYVATGRNVNLTSRLEGLNKHLNTQVLATRELVRQLGPSVIVRRLGFFRFQGFAQLAEVYEVLGVSGPGAARPAWVETFEEAWCGYCARKFDSAAADFSRTIELRMEAEEQSQLSPEFRIEDGPSRFYLDRIEAFRRQPPPAEWIGEVVMDSK